MTTLQKMLLVLGVVAIAGAYFFPQLPVATQSAGSAAGTTFGTAKVAAINYAPATSAASSTSLLNTDTSTRYITDSFMYCSGVNGQGVTITEATTSVANLGLQGNTNLIANFFATTTTTSTLENNATSTEGILTNTSRIWPSGTYLTFLASSSASTASYGGTCNVGAHYLAS